MSISAKVNGRHDKGWGKVDLFSVGNTVAKFESGSEEGFADT